MIPWEWIQQAEARIRPHVVETPLTLDASRGIYLKWENHQVTGSFKARGALNKVLSLTEVERAKGLVAVSAGNHGQGVALAARLMRASVEVFVPAHTAPSKIAAMRELGAEVQIVGGGYGEAEQTGREYARRSGKVFVSPYNDGQIIAGQATLALECTRQLQEMAAAGDAYHGVAVCWIVPVGGGGLIGGCGAVLSRAESRPRLIGVQAAASAFAYSLYHRGTQAGVEDNPTVAEGLSGEIESGSLTIPMLKKYVDDVILVSEDEIRRAVAFAWQRFGERIEGSSAVALAAILEKKVQDLPALVVITGGNIETTLHASIVAEYQAEVWT